MQFFKTFLASLLGTMLGLFLLILILIGVLVSTSTETEPYIRANTVLSVSLSGDIPDRPSDDPFEEIFSPDKRPVSLQGLRNNLKKAAADENIGAVWVKANHVTASWANLETAYRYFQKYKESGKPLYFSTDDIGMNEKSYFLATLADSIFFPPRTGFEFDGFVAQFTFYRPMLEKIGIEPEITRVGKYKSAVEPFLNESSSPESREQTRDILDTVTHTFVSAVSERTGKTHEEVHQLLNSPPVDRVNFAYENGLIDVLAYSDEVEEMIKDRLGVDEDSDLRTVSYARYSRVSDERAGLDTPNTDNKIALIYASGAILPQIAESPFGGTTGITPRNFKRQLESALEDDDVQSIVIHITSPGGADTSSDLIWHSIRQASAKKPVVASMGGVAASGGYYIAMGADTVLAAENTITGSIGIFNLMFNAEELLTEKIGLNYETLKTHEYADLLDISRPFTESEREVMRQNIENGYESFLNRVAESRGMTRDEVHEIAQGRVYTGQTAKDIGLVDLVGDINDALAVAAEMAEIEEYTIDIYPKRRDFFERLMSSSNARIQSAIMGWMPEDLLEDTRNIQMILEHPAGQNWTLLPIRIDVN
jgi:protease IV